MGEPCLFAGRAVPAAAESDPLAYSGQLPRDAGGLRHTGMGVLARIARQPTDASALGATMLGAFFILTDPVTASTTNRGRLIFGALAGLLVWLIRSFGGYPDGVAFAVLLANITVPLIDYYTRPRVYGHR